MVACGGGSSGGADNRAPEVRGLAVMDINQGEVLPGDVLMASYDFYDADGDSESGSAFHWTRDGESIPDASNKTYVVRQADAGKVLHFHVTPRAESGVEEGATVSSPAIQVATPSNQLPVAEAGPDINILVGETAVFSSAGSYDPEGGSLSILWSDPAIQGNPPSRVYDETGSYLVTLTVTDPLGGQASDTVTVNVTREPNTAPVAVIASLTPAVAGDVVQFNGAASSDADGSITAYAWYLDDASTPFDTQANPTRVFDNPGAYRITLVVTDDRGATGRSTAQLMVTAASNIPPVANAGADLTVRVGESFQLDATASADADGSIELFSWSNGLTGATPSLAFANAGTYVLTLTVTDNSGASAEDEVQITVVANLPPVADAGADQSVTAGSTVTFNGAASSDADGDIVGYEWSYGMSGVAPSRVFSEAGVFDVVLTVTDNLGATASDTVRITVQSGENQAPVANAGSDIAILAGQVAQFNGSASSDSDGDIVSYAWSNGLSGVGPSLTYNTPGTYTVTLTVTDDDGASATDTVEVVVSEVIIENTPPVADAGTDIQAVVGSLVTFDGGASSDVDGTIVSYVWSNGLSGVAPSRVYDSIGSFTVELVVTDNLGATARDSVRVNITATPNEPPVARAAVVADIQAGQRAVFDGSASSGVDDDIVAHHWSNGLVGPQGSLVYNQPGSYSVTLSVTDEAGAVAETTISFNVSPKPGIELPADKALYFVNHADWAAPYAYLWGSSPVNSIPAREWPGYAMTYHEALGLWYLALDSSVNSANVVFSDNGQNQTDDLSFSGAHLCYDDGAWVDVEACRSNGGDPFEAGPDRRAELNTRIALSAAASTVDVSRASWSSPAWEGSLSGSTVITPQLTQLGAHQVTVTLPDGLSDSFILDVVQSGAALNERPQLIDPPNFPLEGSVSFGDYEFEPAFPNLALNTWTSPVMVTHDGVNDFIYVVDKAGTLSVFPNQRNVTQEQVVLLLDIRGEARDYHEQGLISVAFHPNFAENRYAYIYYIHGNNDNEMNGDGSFGDAVLQRIRFDSASNPTQVIERVEVLRLPQPGPDHKGGMMQFHPVSGEFYMSIGDGAYGAAAIRPRNDDPRTNNSSQETDNLRGSFIRVLMRETPNAQGKYYDIPTDNPFVNDPAVLDEIWSYGHRNPWRWAFDTVAPYTLWETEVGQSGFEEVNIIQRGGNYGWPICEGTTHRGEDGGDGARTRQCTGDLIGPEGGYDHNAGSKSIIGGFVYRGTRLPGLVGEFIYGDYVSKRIWSKALGQTAELVSDGFPANISSFGTDLSGEEILISSHGEEFGGPSTIYRVVDRAAEAATIPARLSETGLFADLVNLFPMPGVIEYGVASKPWLDGATVRHFVAVPNDAQIAVSDSVLWQLPIGSVLIKHVQLPVSADGVRPFETSVLWRQNSGNWAAANYLWNEAGTDATLVSQADEALVEQYLDGELIINSRSVLSGGDCSGCHAGTGSVDPLGFGGHQLNHTFESQGVGANQVDVFSAIQLLDGSVAGEDLPAFVDPADTAADLGERARAYLHTNCAHCHSGTLMDLNYTTPLAQMGIMNVQRSAGLYRLLPFNPDASILYLYQITDANRMPRGSHLTNSVADQLFRDWINGVGAQLTGLSVSTLQDPEAIKPGVEVTVQARLSYDNGFEVLPSGSVSWTSSAPDVLAVSGNAAQFTAVAGSEGSALITASAEGYTRATTIQVFGGPSAPSNFTATAVSPSTISLSWRDNAGDEDSYLVRRSTASGGPFSTVATLGTNANSYSDSGLNADTRYYYQVLASLDGLNSLPATTSARTQQAADIDSLSIVSGGPVTLIAGETRQLAATASTGDVLSGATQLVNWTSTDNAVVSVSAAGQLTGGATAGSAVVRATYQGVEASVMVTNIGPGRYAYLSMPNEWEQVYIYAWTNNNNVETPRTGAWPGTLMVPALDLGGSWKRFPIASAWANSNNNVSVIFSCGNNTCQTQDLQMSLSANAWYEDGNWRGSAPSGGGGVEEGTQIQVGNGSVTWAGNGSNLSGRLFTPGAAVSVAANPTGPGMNFVHWEGTGVPYLLDPNAASTTMVVNDALSYTLLAVFDAVTDEHVAGRAFYQDEGCSGCHGDDGATVTGQRSLLDVRDTFGSIAALATYIEANMPLGAAGECVGECADSTAAMIWDAAFLPPVGACDADSLDDVVPVDRGFRLLSTLEYNNSVRDLLRLTGPVDVTSGRIPDDIPVNGFKTNANTVFTNDYARGYIVAAEAAAALVSDINALAPTCGSNVECIVRDFAKRAYRRPLSDTEVQELMQVHADQGDLAVLSTVLSSPFMLYRSEIGEPVSGGYFQLSDYEVATLLSYTFWATTPDDALLAAADAGQLSTAEQVAARVRTMLRDSRAELAFERFIKGWLDIDKEIKTANLSDGMKAAMTEETLRFVKSVVFNGGTYRELITADYSYMTEALAQHYGLPWPSGTGEWRRVNYSGNTNAERRGVLGHAGILARQSASEKTHPVKRGLFVRKNLLCQDFPPPPVGAALKPQEDPTLTVRERFEQAHLQDGCETCHQYIDGIGFGLENYNSYGVWQSTETTDSGQVKPINALGYIGSLNSAETFLSESEPVQNYSSMDELAELIAGSSNGKACYARQWYRYTRGQREEVEDSCTIQVFGSEFKASEEIPLLDLMIQFTQTRNYLLRK